MRGKSDDVSALDFDQSLCIPMSPDNFVEVQH